MRRPLVIALALALSAIGCGQDQYSDCNQEKDLDRQIRGCTSVIERGKRESQETRAIAYAKAITLDPSNQLAKNNLKRLGLAP